MYKKLSLLALAALMVCSCESTKREENPVYETLGQEIHFCVKDIQDEVSKSLIEAIGLDVPEILDILGRIGFDRMDELKEVLSDGNTYYSIPIKYKSSAHGEELWLSGRLYYRKSSDGSIETPNHIMISNRITTTSGGPSTGLGVESFLMKNGAMIIVPDLIGHGITDNIPEPYCVPSLTVTAAYDMYAATMDFLRDRGIKDGEKIPVYITGYSQGGLSALAEVRAFQEGYKGKVNLVSAYLGSGPYSMKAFQDDWVENDKCGYPLSIGLTIIGLKYAYPDIMTGDYSDYFTKEFMDAGIVDKILSKKYPSNVLGDDIYKVFPPDRLGYVAASSILKKECLTPGEKRYQELDRAARACEMASGWKPEVPVHIIHDEQDTYVPFYNFELAQKGINNANCTFEDLGNLHLGSLNHLAGGAVFYVRMACGDYLKK